MIGISIGIMMSSTALSTTLAPPTGFTFLLGLGDSADLTGADGQTLYGKAP